MIHGSWFQQWDSEAGAYMDLLTWHTSGCCLPQLSPPTDYMMRSYMVFFTTTLLAH